jgi:hypothetical protein
LRFGLDFVSTFPSSPEESEDVEAYAAAAKSYELCAGAANHIAVIGMLYIISDSNYLTISV